VAKILLAVAKHATSLAAALADLHGSSTAAEAALSLLADRRALTAAPN